MALLAAHALARFELDRAARQQDDPPFVLVVISRLVLLASDIMSAKRRFVAWYLRAATLLAFAGYASVNVTLAQSSVSASKHEVRSASFERNATLPTRGVTFGWYANRVGDQVEQTITLGMRMTTLLRQGNQLVAKSESTMHGRQRRVIVTTDVDSGRATAVTVHYLQAVRHVTNAAGSAPTPTAARGEKASPPTTQPVEGKTYACRREGGEEGQLTITDTAGNIPPLSEYDIVAHNMEMVGRQNPLAQFLANRSVAAGETLTLPKEAADRLFNLGERFGEIRRFELTLRGIAVEDGAECAVFAAHIEAASNDSSQMRLQVDGRLLVQSSTCRAVRAELAGPLALSESRGSYSAAQQLIGTGQLTVRMAAVYGAALP